MSGVEPMTSDEVQEAFEECKAASSKAERDSLLKGYLEDELFRFCIVQALDPRIRFGVARKTLEKIFNESSELGNHDWDSGPVHVPTLLDACRDGERINVDLLATLPGVLSSQSWNLVERILLKKPDIGATSSTLNRVEPGLIFTFDCMLAKPFEGKRVKEWPVAVEPKLDGVRCLAVVDKTGDVEIYSRSGKPLPGVQHMGEHLIGLPDIYESTADLDMLGDGFVLDGEIVSGEFNETSGAARRGEKAEDAVFNIFDVIPLGEWRAQDSTIEYRQRRDILMELLTRPELEGKPFALVPRYLARDEAEVQHYYQAFRDRGLEGAIVKPSDHLYEFKRSWAWMKIKGQETEDLRIVAFQEGTGKYRGMMGAVYVERHDEKNGRVEVKVGGGWSDEQRREMWSDREAYMNRLIEVEFHEVTPDGSLRHPRFIRWRDDKDVRELAA